MKGARLLSVVVIALLAATVSSFAAAPPSVLVRTASLQRGRLGITITGYGSIIIDPRRVVTVSVPRPGRLSRLSVASGQLVRRAKPLATFATDPSAVQGFRQAISALEFARGELKRTESMADLRLATQSQLAAARKAVSDAEATVAAQRRLGMQHVHEQLRAPFGGIVTAVSAKEGDVLPAGAPILQLAQRGAFVAVLGVEPEDSRRIRKGMTARLASVFDPGQTFPGRVREVHGVIDPQTRLVEVVIEIGGPGAGTLIPGMRLRGELVTGEVAGWLVPRSAILHDGSGSYLYQADRGRARRVRVKTGPERQGLVEVQGKVDPDLKVVTVGNYELSDGMPLREERP